MKKKANICLICCRGGSKTIKNKNIKLFAKKPLLYWTIKSALNSKVFNRIILSTDSKKIAYYARKFKIEVPGLRPKKLSLSSSNQFDTHNYIFKKLNLNDKNSLVCILNNNPFINKNYIKKSYDRFKKNNFKGIVTDYSKVSGDYMVWKQCTKSNDSLKYLFKKSFLKVKLNRQNLNNFFVNIFNLRWGKPSYLENYNSFKKQLLKNNNKSVELKKIDNFDIDDHEDWFIAQTIFEKRFVK
jgi:CMP-N-acetylneuraminic acid synthetase